MVEHGKMHSWWSWIHGLLNRPKFNELEIFEIILETTCAWLVYTDIENSPKGNLYSCIKPEFRLEPYHGWILVGSIVHESSFIKNAFYHVQPFKLYIFMSDNLSINLHVYSVFDITNWLVMNFTICLFVEIRHYFSTDAIKI
jgi:hypothetical protein